MTASILAVGLREAAKFMDSVPELATMAAYLAVNDTARDAVPMLKREMRKEINFPSSYLNKERLSVRRKASQVTLEAVISGRDRPTSLARFAEGATPQNSSGRPIFVKVKGTGAPARLNRAFLLTLRNGNMGLAIRLPKGQTPDRAYKPVEMTRGGGKAQGAWLLYGPSVDQVLRGVIPTVSDEVAANLDRSFFRQFSRLANRG